MTRSTRRRAFRQLHWECLEDRRLMAFNVLNSYTTNAGPQELVSAHFSNDGIIDLVTLGADNVTVYLGNGVGGFGVAIPSPTGEGARAIAVGDFTLDGANDLVTANGSDLSFLKGNGDGTFAAPQSLSLPARIEDGVSKVQLPLSVVMGDLNGDGKMDLAVSAQTRVLTGTGYYGNYYESKGYVNVLIGNGSGGFNNSATQPLGQDWIPGPVAIADYNNDGKNDVLTSNQAELSVALGDGAGGLVTTIRSGAGNVWLSASLAVGDLDEDGILDTVLRTATGGLRIQKGDGTGRFTPSTDLGLNATTRHLPVVTGDINEDGTLDLVSAFSHVTFRSFGYYGGYDPYVTRLTNVILGQGHGTFSAAQTAVLNISDGFYSTNIPALQLADFNRDGRVDLALVDQSSSYLAVAENDGKWVGIPGIGISDATATESDSVTTHALFTVTLSSAHSTEVRVDYRTINGTAIAGADFIHTAGTLVFAPGAMTGIIAIPILVDFIDEYDETFDLELTNAVHAQIGDAVGISTVLDNDLPPRLSISDVTKQEGSDLSMTPFEFVLNLSAPSEKYIFTTYELADGTARSIDNDYYYTPYGEVHFPPGTTVATLTAYVFADGMVEPNESFFVNLLDPSETTLSDRQAMGTIVNDDTAANIPTISIGDASIVEGNSGSRWMYFDVTLSFAYSQEIRVNYQTANGSATTSNNDYVSAAGTLRFASNVRTQTIAVSIKGDKKKEADERFSVLLSNAVRGAITDNLGIGTIINDDGNTGRSQSSSLRQVDVALAELGYQDMASDDSFIARLRKRRL